MRDERSRFPERVEAEYKKSLEPEILRFGVAGCLIHIVVIIMYWAQFSPDNADQVYCIVILASLIVLALLRLCGGLLQTWEWEGAILLCTAIASTWSLVGLLTGNLSDSSYSTSTKAFAVSFLEAYIPLFALFVPIRTIWMWIVPVGNVVCFTSIIFINGSAFPGLASGLEVLVLWALTVGVLYGARRHQRHLRKEWVASQQSRASQEVSQEQQVEIQAELAQQPELNQAEMVVPVVVGKRGADDGRESASQVGTEVSFNLSQTTVNSYWEPLGRVPIMEDGATPLLELNIENRTNQQAMENAAERPVYVDSATQTSGSGHCATQTSGSRPPQLPRSGREPRASSGAGSDSGSSQSSRSSCSSRQGPRSRRQRGREVQDGGVVLARTMASKYLPTEQEYAAGSIIMTMRHWNLTYPSDACCPYHAAVWAVVDMAMNYLSASACRALWSPYLGWQCAGCTCMNEEKCQICLICQANRPEPSSDEDSPGTEESRTTLVIEDHRDSSIDFNVDDEVIEAADLPSQCSVRDPFRQQL